MRNCIYESFSEKNRLVPITSFLVKLKRVLHVLIIKIIKKYLEDVIY